MSLLGFSDFLVGPVGYLKGNRAGELIELVKCLLCKDEDLSLIPMVVHTCKPRAGEAETGESLGLTGQPP